MEQKSVMTHFALPYFDDALHCEWKKMDDMKVMLAMIRIIWISNESYHYKMAFGLCAWTQT